jgi:hypothetical protein
MEEKIAETEKYKIGIDIENNILIFINKETNELERVSIDWIFEQD